MPKADSAYLKNFNKALLNFEQNIREERILNRGSKVAFVSHKKTGF